MSVEAAFAVRSIEPADLEHIVALDAVLTGTSKGEYWRRVIERLQADAACLGLAVLEEGGGGTIDGYLFGEVRAVEFGSEECGWIIALGVRPDTTRQGRASALVDAAKQRFGELGVNSIRTMVQRTDVPFLALFRGQGFVGGPFVQLELNLLLENER